MLFACAFFAVFGIVIALLKDAPDAKGDELFRIRTFTVRLGVRTVFWGVHALMAALYLASAVCTAQLAASAPAAVCAALLHLGVVGVLLLRARKVDLAESKSVYKHYMDVWKAFYLEYAILPIIA